MANFSFYVSSIGTTTVDFIGYFTDGDPNYPKYRAVLLTINGSTTLYNSQSAGGANSTFSVHVSGLTQGTSYSWSVVLGYYDDLDRFVATSYTESGIVITDRENTPILDLDVSAITYSSATFYGQFKNGDPSYGNYRYVRMTINGQTHDYISLNSGGSTSNFNFTVTGLPSDSYLYWHAVVCFIVDGVMYETNVTDSGYLQTPEAPGYSIYIADGSRWRRYAAYIGDGARWSRYTVRIGDGRAWQPN